MLQVVAFLHTAQPVYGVRVSLASVSGAVRVLLAFSFQFQLALFFILPCVTVPILLLTPIPASAVVCVDRFISPCTDFMRNCVQRLVWTEVWYSGRNLEVSSFTWVHPAPFTMSRTFCQRWAMRPSEETKAVQPRGQQSWQPGSKHCYI